MVGHAGASDADGASRTHCPTGVTVSEADVHAESEDGPVKAFGSLHGVLASDAGPGAFQVLLYAPDPTEPLPGPVTTTDADGNTETVVEVAGQSLAQRLKCRTYMTTCEPLLDDAGTVIGRVRHGHRPGDDLLRGRARGSRRRRRVPVRRRLQR